MKLSILSILLVFFPCLYAVNNLRLPDMRSIGMGECGVTQSFLFNPALVSLSDCKYVGIDYFNRYSLKELGTIGIGFCYPNNLLSVGVNIASFGYDKYRESMFRISLSKRLNAKWNVGISFQYALLQTELTDQQPQRLSTDFGLLFSPVEKMLIGMLIMDFPSFSMNKKTIENKDFKIYSVQLGFQWEVINRVLIVGNAGSNKNSVLTGGGGIDYELLEGFHVRAGIKAAPLLPTFGAGYRFSGFAVDITAVYHAVLGISTGIGLKYTF